MSKERRIGRRPILIALALVLIAVAIGALALMGGAAEPKPTLAIAGTSLSFKDNIYMNFYVSAENADELKLLIWEAPQSEYRIGTEQYRLTNSAASGSYKRFVFDEFAARQMTKEVYACAHTNVGGVDYYSDPFKFSMHTYAYGIINGGSAYSESMKALCREMLDYGAAAQVHFDGATARLANDNWLQITVSGGLLSDGTRKGLYLEGDVIGISAPETDAGGEAFYAWKDSTGGIVSREPVCSYTVGAVATTLTPVYGSEMAGYSIVYPGDGSDAMEMTAGNLYSRMADNGAMDMTMAQGIPPTTDFIHLCDAQQFEYSYGVILGYNDYCIKPLPEKKGFAIGGGGIAALETAVKVFTENYAELGLEGSLAADQVTFRYTSMPSATKYATRLDEIIDVYENPDDPTLGRMMSMSHRGDHQNYPENSLGAIQSCIDGGVDIVEIDVWQSADGQWFLLHDLTLARTTNATGTNATTDPRTMNLSTIQSYTLKQGLGDGAVTKGNVELANYANPAWNRIPSLAEVFDLCKGKIMISLDRVTGASQMSSVRQLAIDRGYDVRGLQLKSSFNDIYQGDSAIEQNFDSWYADGRSPQFMPMISATDAESAIGKINASQMFIEKTFMVEFQGLDVHHSNENLKILAEDSRNNKQARLLYSSIYSEDDTTVWADCYRLGYGAIMTDRPLELAAYIRSVSNVRDSSDTIRAAHFTGNSDEIRSKEGSHYSDDFPINVNEYKASDGANTNSIDMCGYVVDGISDGEYIILPNISFSGHEKQIQLSAKVRRSGNIKVYADSADGVLLANVALSPDGEYRFKTVTAEMSGIVSGLHDVVMVFETEEDYFAELDLVTFRSQSDSSKKSAFNIFYEAYAAVAPNAVVGGDVSGAHGLSGSYPVTLPTTVSVPGAAGRIEEVAVSWNIAEDFVLGDNYANKKYNVTGTTSDGRAVSMVLTVKRMIAIESTTHLNDLGANSWTNSSKYYNHAGEYIRLMNDIDYEGSTTGFMPIGNDSCGFRGEVDGAGYSVKNLGTAASPTSQAGLFRNVKRDCYIHDLTLEGCHFKTGASSYMGALATIAQGARIDNCNVIDCSVVSTKAGGGGRGGLVGFVLHEKGDDTFISNCTVSNTTISGEHDLAGLIGKMESGYIFNCRAENATITTTNATGGSSIGGFVGTYYGGFLEDCYASAASMPVAQSGTNRGAFIGYADYTQTGVDNVDIPVFLNCTWDGTKTSLPGIGLRGMYGSETEEYIGYLGAAPVAGTPDFLPYTIPNSTDNTSTGPRYESVLSDARPVADFDTNPPSVSQATGRGTCELAAEGALSGNGLYLYSDENAASGQPGYAIIAPSTGKVATPETGLITVPAGIDSTGYTGLLYYIDGSKMVANWKSVSYTAITPCYFQVSVQLTMSNTADTVNERSTNVRGFYYQDGRWVETHPNGEHRMLLPSGFVGWVYIPLASYTDHNTNVANGYKWLKSITVYTDSAVPAANGRIEYTIDNIYLVK